MSNPIAPQPRFVSLVLAGALLLLGLYLSFALLVDPVSGLAWARKVSVQFAMYASWAAFGAVLVVWLLPENRRRWRFGLLLLAIFPTGVSLYLKTEAYNGTLLPTTMRMVVPMMSGAAAAALLALFNPAVPGLGPHTGGQRHRVWIAIAVALALAVPMVVSPVVENWNASGWMDSHGYDTYAHNILSGKVPEGSSQYMPFYQYGLAAVYYLFGHFFFAQQLVNILLTFVTIVLVCLAAWNLFRNVWAVLVIGTWMAFMRPFVYAVFFTQIESWYTPIIAFTIFAWTCYWRWPSRLHLVLLAIGAGVAMNTRNQGAFYFAWLCLAPLFIGILPWKRRFAHTALAIVILAMSLVPWSLRNYVVDGRLSPSAARNAYYLAVLNDPRIGFYGVRYWEGWGDIASEYDRKYPDVGERDRVMMRDGLTAPFRNPRWFAKAVFWRTVAFYELLSESIFAAEGPRAPNWAVEWRSYVYWKIAPLMLLPLSLIGLAVRPGRVTLFLAVAILANLGSVALAGGAEGRVSYPVLPMHMLIALAAVFVPQPHEQHWSAVRSIFGVARPRTWVVAAIGVLVFLIGARVQFGRANLYAPLVERNVFVSTPLEIDQSLPSLNAHASTSYPPVPLGPEWEGRTIRLRFVVFNYQCPPKYGGRIGYMPDFATDPGRETYYYGALLPAAHDRKPLSIAMTWFGATVNEPLREGDEVEAEARVLLAPGNAVPTYWLRIDKARKVPARSTEVPAFF